jgi:hypothetical protein
MLLHLWYRGTLHQRLWHSGAGQFSSIARELLQPSGPAAPAPDVSRIPPHEVEQGAACNLRLQLAMLVDLAAAPEITSGSAAAASSTASLKQTPCRFADLPIVTASLRQDGGSKVSRRLRTAGFLPSALYYLPGGPRSLPSCETCQDDGDRSHAGVQPHRCGGAGD